VLVDLEASEAARKAVEAGLEALAAGLAAALRLVDARQRHLIQGHYPLAPTLQLAHPGVCEKSEKRVALLLPALNARGRERFFAQREGGAPPPPPPNALTHTARRSRRRAPQSFSPLGQ
jgi:hypothetical protein